MRHILTTAVFIFALSLSLTVIGLGHNAAADDSLDGKSFSVQITEHGKSGDPTADTLTFEGGNFMSSDCEQYGFTPAAYETKTKGGATLFKSTLMSEKEGKAEWEGAVKGDKIRGTFIWTKEGQDPIVYTYLSTPENAAAPADDNPDQEPEIQREKDKEPEAP